MPAAMMLVVHGVLALLITCAGESIFCKLYNPSFCPRPFNLSPLFSESPYIMSSPLERALLRLKVFSKEPHLEQFIQGYLPVRDMLNLRLTSRSLYRLTELKQTSFETIYVQTPVPPGREKSIETLEKIAGPCRQLVIRIAYPVKLLTSLRKAPPSDNDSASSYSATNSEGSSDIKDSSCPYVEAPIAWKFLLQRKPGQVDQALLDQWCRIFKLFPDMEVLHISCNGDPAWPGCTDIEALLIILRIAIERADPKRLHTVRLSPIHAMGIMHLRWSGAGAYGEATAACNPVWQRLGVLELQIFNPYMRGRLSTPQKHLFSRILTDYLQSFSLTLTRLNFSWLGANGPNPFMLAETHKNPKLTKIWGNLKELWLRNVVLDTKAPSEIRKRAPNLRRLMLSMNNENSEGGMACDIWNDHLKQVHANEGNGAIDWRNMQVVRYSAIPVALFENGSE